MFDKLCLATAAVLALAPVANAAEPGTTPVPEAVRALAGCWAGLGEVMAKPVSVALTGRSIVQGAMFALDAESSAVADPGDRYSAHLLFGGTDKRAGTTADQIVGFWADSFGGAFTASGQGASRSAGFDMTYLYPDYAFVNRWSFSAESLTWQIVARDAKGTEKPFASYSLHKAACQPSQTPL